MIRPALALVFVLLSCTLLQAEELRILAWNVESGGNNPSTIAQQIDAFDGYHIIALTEVNRDNFDSYAVAGFGRDHADDAIRSETGGGDRMMILFDDERLQLVSSSELHEHDGISLNARNQDGHFRFRSPLIAQFRDKLTNVEFLLMVNHLARGSSSIRQTQARGLREWGKDQTLPTIAVGDFNFDLEFNSNGPVDGNTAYDVFLADDTWLWVEPDPLIDTNHAGNDDSDDYPNSILDFAFVAGDAKSWSAASDVIVRGGDFPDNNDTSDHRPIELLLDIPGSDLPVSDLLEQIQAIRANLNALEELIRNP